MMETAKREFAQEKERGLQIMKEEARVELRIDLTKQVESEFQEKLVRVKALHEEEL